MIRKFLKWAGKNPHITVYRHGILGDGADIANYRSFTRRKNTTEKECTGTV